VQDQNQEYWCGEREREKKEERKTQRERVKKKETDKENADLKFVHTAGISAILNLGATAAISI
jgi:hypothetical protein